MPSFRSNLNSVSSTHDGLTAIQSRLTTCFENLRHKFVEFEHPSRQNTRREPNIKWYQQNYKDYRLLKKAKKNLKNLSSKLRKYFWTNFRVSKSRQHESRPTYRKGETFTKFCSSTQVEAPHAVSPFTYNDNSRTTTTATARTTFVGLTSSMTVIEDSFLLIREEYPELDREIRSILMARAQTGATIAEIKEDYCKNTGLRFPVYQHITDFLLCIPGIMAYCNEHGTRIFNVQPTAKTKHIYDMVTQQKAPSEYRCDSTAYRRYNGIHTNIAIPTWRTGTFCKASYQSARLNEPLISSNLKNQLQQQQQKFLPPPHSVTENSSRNESDGSAENRGGYYRDNCQYLFNRIYNNYENNKENVNDLNKNENHAVTTAATTTTTTIDSDLQNHVHDNPSKQIDKDMNIFKRPKGRAVRGTIMRASSPTSGTRSSHRSDSIYSTDLDYEAHLLDFPLLGDDFFMYLARMELRCKFKKQQKILQSGLCVSGQTIKEATRRIKSSFNAYANRRIIVNIGSVDIMQGKPLVQIQHDFRQLINAINKRGLRPILTTLAPLANCSHDPKVKMTVERFNEFIKRESQFLLVIDIWSLFVNERKQTLFDCYQNEPRQVTGARESYVFWNKIGRQRVLQAIESNLEY